MVNLLANNTLSFIFFSWEVSKHISFTVCLLEVSDERILMAGAARDVRDHDRPGDWAVGRVVVGRAGVVGVQVFGVKLEQAGVVASEGNTHRQEQEGQWNVHPHEGRTVEKTSLRWEAPQPSKVVATAQASAT